MTYETKRNLKMAVESISIHGNIAMSCQTSINELSYERKKDI